MFYKIIIKLVQHASQIGIQLQFLTLINSRSALCILISSHRILKKLVFKDWMLINMDILQWNWLFSFYHLFFYKQMPGCEEYTYQQFYTPSLWSTLKNVYLLIFWQQSVMWKYLPEWETETTQECRLFGSLSLKFLIYI